MGYDLYALQNNVDTLTAQGKYHEAIELLKKETEAIRDDNAVHGAILNELGGLCRAVGPYAESESAFKKAMEILGKSPGEDSILITRRQSITLPEHTRLMGEHAKADLFLLKRLISTPGPWGKIIFSTQALSTTSAFCIRT